MKRTYIVNGKVTYPTNEGSNTTFTFINKDTGELFNMQTTDDTEANSMTYGDNVVVEVTKVTIIPAPENPTEKTNENTETADAGAATESAGTNTYATVETSAEPIQGEAGTKDEDKA